MFLTRGPLAKSNEDARGGFFFIGTRLLAASSAIAVAYNSAWARIFRPTPYHTYLPPYTIDTSVVIDTPFY